MKKIVNDWKILEGLRFRELIVYTYNYTDEYITKYGLDNGKPYKQNYRLVESDF